MAIKNLYYNNNEAVKQIITEVELNAHNTSADAHKDKFSEYTLQTPIGIWNAMYQLGTNYTFTDETTKGFAKLGLFACVYDSKDVFKNQPSQYGTLLNIPTSINEDTLFVTVSQLWFDQSGDLFIRTGTVNNSIGNMEFTKITLVTDEFNKAGTEFPATNLTTGMLFYRTDTKILYAYSPDDTDTSSSGWIAVFDLNKDVNTADKLSHPWYKIGNSTEDTSIPQLEPSDNLNAYKTAGVYSCTSTQIANSITNKPSTVNTNFKLIVEENTPGNGIQRIITNNPAKIYIRGFTFTEESSTFTDWKTMLSNTDEVLLADTATRDSGGNVIANTYVKKSGDTMTGGITYSSSIGNSYIGPGEADVSDAITANKANTTINSWQTVGIKWNNNPYVISMNSRTGDIHTSGSITSTGNMTAPNFIGSASEAKKVYLSNITTKTTILETVQSDLDGCAIQVGAPGDCDFYIVLNDSASNGDSPASVVVEQRYNNYQTLLRRAVLLGYDGNTSFPGTVTATKVVNAVYNDYAEFFERGEDTEAGDIIALDLNSDKEVYCKANTENSIVVGIHSEEYAHIIGGDKDKSVEENTKNYIPVALAGRVHVKVYGKVNKGDKIILSKNYSGVGVSINNTEEACEDTTVVGIALENKITNDLGKVRLLLKWGGEK